MSTTDTMPVTEWAALRLPDDDLSAELLAGIVIRNAQIAPDQLRTRAEWETLFTPTTIHDLSVAHLLDTCRCVDRIIERLSAVRQQGVQQ